MKNKDHRNMTLEQALLWVQHNCRFEDVRKRMASRSVAYILAQTISDLITHCKNLENRIKELEK